MSPKIQSIIAEYEKSIRVFEDAVKGVPASLLDKSPAPGKWSIRQIAVHITDSDVVGAHRFRTIAAEPGMTMLGYDQDKWANHLHYEKQTVEDALDCFRALRRQTAAMLRALPESAWQNTAVHNERGEVKLDDYVLHYVHHVENHVKQIRAIRERFA